MHEADDTERPAPASAEATRGRVLALDWGTKRVGVAVSDELRMTARPLPVLQRASWKQLLGKISVMLREFDVRRVVFGLPLRLDGTEGDAAQEVRRVARNLNLSLGVPVSLQDERMTSREAEGELRAAGCDEAEVARRRDSEAARIILSDYLSRAEEPGEDTSEAIQEHQ